MVQSDRRFAGRGLLADVSWFGGAVVAAVAATFVSPLWGHIAVLVLLWAAMGSAWNLLGGLTGRLSLGQAAYFGVGAYTCSLLYTRVHVTPWLGLLAAGVVAAVLALVIALPTIRLAGPYFTLATVAAPVILANIATAAGDLTRGARGVIVPYRPSIENMIFADKLPYVLIAAGILALAQLAMGVATRGRQRIRLRALRDDANAARSLGVPTTRLMIVLAVLGAVLTGMVGAVYGQYVLFITPASAFSLNISVDAIAVAVLGGLGRSRAAIIGAAVLVCVRQLLFNRFLGDYPGLDQLIIGAALFTVVVLARFHPRLSDMVRTRLGQVSVSRRPRARRADS